MRSIGEFFNRINALQQSELGRRSIVCEAIKNICSLEIPVEKVTVKKNAIHIDVPHMEKSIIKLHSQAILSVVSSHKHLSSVNSII